MQLSVIKTRALVGIEAPLVRVETHLSFGLPAFNIVGMPETTVRESKDRVRSAIINSHFEFPDGKITINLAPADLPKEGGRFDLAIALGILTASGQVRSNFVSQFECVGELGLNGVVHPVPGVLAAAKVCADTETRLMVSSACAAHAAQVNDCFVVGVGNLVEAAVAIKGKNNKRAARHLSSIRPSITEDLSDVRGQAEAKRALEIAAAGGHHIFLYGPPGTGKTLLASRLPGILPPLTPHEELDVRLVQDLVGTSHGAVSRPFRAPHHSASSAALVGGGVRPKPGEITMAHRGVLFLDEMAEFPRATLDMLREPLESGHVRINRAKASVTYPAEFQLVAAANPCPCGYLGDPERKCRCSMDQIDRYHARLSGPLLDRIDLFCRVERLSADLLLRDKEKSETSSEVAVRIIDAQSRALERQNCLNANASGDELVKSSICHSDATSLLSRAAEKMNLSGRAVHRALRVARTIADLADEPQIQRAHMIEAIDYRQLNLGAH